MKWVLGGWQWTGVMQFQTGRPYTVISGTDNSLDGIGNDRAKLTGASASQPPDGFGADRVVQRRRRSRVNDLGTFGNTRQGRLLRPDRCRPGTWGCSRTSAWART